MFKLIAITALLVSALALQPAFADEVKMTPMISRTISMSGHGEAHAIPDTAQISLGVATYAKTAREALTTNNKSMTDLIDIS